MFRKEILDTVRSLGVYVLVSAVITVISYAFIHFSSTLGLTYIEYLSFIIQIILLLLSFYLGSELFSEEKTQNTFEYLFSLKLSRWQILLYKLLPRFFGLLVFLVLYFFYKNIFDQFPQLIKTPVFVLLYFAFFFFFASLSMLDKNNALNITYNLVIFAFVYGLIMVISNVGFLFNIFEDVSFIHEINLSQVSIQIFFVISIVFFAGFILTFKKIDLNNMSSLFLKKYLVWVGMVVAGLFLIFIVINQMDTARSPDALTVKDLKPATFDKNNGYYMLCALLEPPEVDIESHEILTKYRQYHDPQFDNETHIRDFRRATLRDFFRKRDIQWIDVLGERKPKDMCSHILNNRKNILSLKSEYSLLLHRYQRLIDKPVFEDFSKLDIDSPIPNLQAWLRMTKLYVAVHMLDAMEGNWERGVSKILEHILFCKRAIKGSRVLYTNLIGKSVLRTSLQGLSNLMNHDKCPREVYIQVLEGLTPIKYEEFGTRDSYIAEYLVWDIFINERIFIKYKNKMTHLLINLFLQKNRTREYLNGYFIDLIDYEKTLPYQCEYDFGEKHEKRFRKLYGGSLWWVQNPIGKMILKNYVSPNYLSIVTKSYYTKSLYDMTRISAEFHLSSSSGKSAQEILSGLKTYQTLLDPCSGKPYRYNTEKQVIYSLGTDLDDDGGKGEPIVSVASDTDFVLLLPLHPKK